MLEAEMDNLGIFENFEIFAAHIGKTENSEILQLCPQNLV